MSTPRKWVPAHFAYATQVWSWSDIEGFFFSSNRDDLCKPEHLPKLNLGWYTRRIFSFLMWWTVIVNIRSFILETAVSNSWRQPVNGHLSSSSSVSIDWIRWGKYVYFPPVASYKETCKASTVSHWLGSLESWKSHQLFQITKVYSPS